MLFLSSIVLIVLLTSSFVTLVNADSLMWSQTYGGVGSDIAYSVIETADGGYAIAGSTTSFGAGGEDFWLVKTDAYGNMTWSKTYGGTGNDVARAVVNASNGGYVLAGYTTSFGAGSSDFWLVKTDASGNMQWNRTYGGEYNDWGCSLVATGDGGFVLAGATDSFITGSGDCWLVKVNGIGGIEWSQIYETGYPDFEFKAMYDCGYWLAATSDGGYAIAGQTAVFLQYWNLVLLKTDESGDLEWKKTIIRSGYDEFNSLVEASDGGYAIASKSFGRGAGLYDFWLIKTDEFGDREWNITYGGTSMDRAHSLIETSDGGYAIAGETSSFGSGGEDFWLVKTDEYGAVPEYSSWLLPSLLLTATLVIVIYKKELFNQH